MLPETLYHNREVSDIDYLFTYEENREVKSASERRKGCYNPNRYDTRKLLSGRRNSGNSNY